MIQRCGLAQKRSHGVAAECGPRCPVERLGDGVGVVWFEKAGEEMRGAE